MPDEAPPQTPLFWVFEGLGTGFVKPLRSRNCYADDASSRPRFQLARDCNILAIVASRYALAFAILMRRAVLGRA